MSSPLSQIQYILEQRKSVNPITPTPHNYPIKTKKIIKEYGKVLIASKDSGGEHLIYKTTNLCFHNMMLLVQHGLRVEKCWQN